VKVTFIDTRGERPRFESFEAPWNRLDALSFTIGQNICFPRQVSDTHGIPLHGFEITRVERWTRVAAGEMHIDTIHLYGEPDLIGEAEA
jgi:hypothetical protein